MRISGKTTSFMALLWCTSPFMHDRKPKDYNLLHRPSVHVERIL